LRKLNQDFDVPILYITHDLTTAYHVSDYIMIMYRGSVMEAGDVDSVIREPQHPYTQLLVGSIPWPDPDRAWGEMEAVFPKATTYDPRLSGCKFAPRCPFAFDPCSLERPPLFRVSDSRAACCYLYADNETMDRHELQTLFPRTEQASARVEAQ
jgi:peptide/nickel transport system ATP-binding protein